MVILLIAVVVVGVAFLGYGFFVEPARLVVSEKVIPIESKKLSRPVRILFLSDIHAGPASVLTHWEAKAQQLWEIHKKEPFELILWGGDYRDYSRNFQSRLESIIKPFAVWKLPMYGVLGNHDYFDKDSVDGLVQILKKSGITILRSESETIQLAHHTKLLVIGLEELQTSSDYTPGIHSHLTELKEYKDHAEKLDWLSRFDGKEKDLPRILLGHNPDVSLLPSQDEPDLILSGHTHGGQFWPVTWLAPYLRRFMPPGSFLVWAGERLVDMRWLIVSRGLGNALIPFRFGRTPEVVAVTLQPFEVPKDLIIGLSGKPRSGKDTVATMIARLLPGMTRLTFGTAIKKEYDALNGTDTLHNHEQKFEHRNAINELGAKRRAEDLYYWVKKTITEPPPLLITDVRQPHEASYIKEKGNILIRINASRETVKKRMGKYFDAASQFDHKQESLLDDYQDWDYVIENDGTLADLEAKVREICADILTRNTNQ